MWAVNIITLLAVTAALVVDLAPPRLLRLLLLLLALHLLLTMPSLLLP